MKPIYRAAVIAGIFAVGGMQAVRAQQAERVVEFHAPFAFQVENAKLSAGDYIILEQSGWVQVQTKGGRNAAHVLTMPVNSKDQNAIESSQVVFHGYAGRYYLSEIWVSGQAKGRELLESKEEQQLAKREKIAKVTLPARGVAAK